MGNKKVLVADDEIHIVQVVAMKLRNNGLDVVLRITVQTLTSFAVRKSRIL